MLKYWLALGGAVLISAISQMLLKKAARIKYANVVREYLNPWVISGYLLLATSTVCVIYAFKGVDFKNAPVFESLGFPLVMVFGRIFFKEKLTRNKLIGLGLIMLGILVYYF